MTRKPPARTRKSSPRRKKAAPPGVPAPIPDQDLESYAEQAYLDYSMYVVRHRALPHISDGLKPVQRRIVYAMHQLGLGAGNKPKKSARTVGDVLGKFHPHGDSACYEAMVLMAQPFSIRYPIIQGQGNWGSTDDPRSFAAMRYTEARLTEYAGELLAEIGQGTVDMQDNFDGSLKEPAYLPARLPNILLNGSSGIAVGLSTDIPPHNINELAQACAVVLRKKTARLAELLEHLRGPDFPGGCTVVATRAELEEFYRTGSASLRLRAVYHLEGRQIVFTRLPHQVSIGQIMAQLHKHRDNKKIPMVRQYRDESDEENEVRLVVQLQSGGSWEMQQCVEHLLAITDLECSCRAQMNVLSIQRRPETMGLLEVLRQWLDWRVGIVRRRVQWRLDGIAHEMQRIRAFLQIFDDLDRIIAIIRASDDPGAALQQEFGYSDFVVGVILETKLRQLARLEELALRKELKKLELERIALRIYIESEAKLKGLVRQEILREAKKFAQPRRSQIEEGEPSVALDVRRLAPVVDLTVLLTRHGWVRAGRAGEFDLDSVSLRTGDTWVSVVNARSDQNGYCFDERGRVYRLALGDLPPVRGPGEPVSKRFRCQPGTLWAGMVAQACPRVVLCSRQGQGFICSTEKFASVGSQGRPIMRMPEGVGMMPPQALPAGTDDAQWYLAVLTSEGLLLILALSEIPARSSGQGVRLLQLTSKSARKNPVGDESTEVCSCCLLCVQDELHLRDSAAKKKTLQPHEWEKYIKARGRRGAVTRVFRNSRASSVSVQKSGESAYLFDPGPADDKSAS